MTFELLGVFVSLLLAFYLFGDLLTLHTLDHDAVDGLFQGWHRLFCSWRVIALTDNIFEMLRSLRHNHGLIRG